MVIFCTVSLMDWHIGGDVLMKLRRFERVLWIAGALLCTVLSSFASAADTSNTVIAIVNGYLISDYDLGQHIGLYTRRVRYTDDQGYPRSGF